MLTPETNYIMAIEQHKDRIHNFERRQLLEAAHHDTQKQSWYRQVCRQTGRLLKTWGARLEHYGDPASSKTISMKI